MATGKDAAEKKIVEGPKLEPIEAPAPEIKVVAVAIPLLQETINLLQTELPMKTVRNIVLQLEQCPIMAVNQKPKEK